jgi:hypothetical protein
VTKYGEQSLATPHSSFSWLLPSIAFVGGLSLVFIAGRRIITRGRGQVAAKPAAAAATPAADDKYTDKLEDELADTD